MKEIQRYVLLKQKFSKTVRVKNPREYLWLRLALHAKNEINTARIRLLCLNFTNPNH